MAGGALEILVMALLAALSATCVVAGVRSLGGELRLVRRMDGLGRPSPGSRAAAALAERLGGLLIGAGKDRAEIEQNLHIAGFYHPSAPAIFVWVRLGLSVGAGLAAALAVVLAGGWRGYGPWLPWGAAGATYLLSKRVLGWSASRRRRKISAELPFVLDVFLIMLESGVSLDQTFRTFVRTEGRAAPILKEAVAVLVADIERGVPHEQALDRWGARLGVSGSRELAALFKRNLAHGSELSAALKGMAREFTDKRVSSAREAVGRKSAQMAAVMMIFFMPALFIVLAGPAVVTLLRTLRGMMI
jgi:tight adherence protein C